MKFRHKVVLALADGKAHTLAELYTQLGKLVRPETVARMYQDGSRVKMTIEEKMTKGRVRAIRHQVGYLLHEKHAVHLSGEDLNATYMLTETGMGLAKKIRELPSANPDESTPAVPRSMPEANDARGSIRAVATSLLTNEWTDESELMVLAVENISDAVAVNVYRFYQRADSALSEAEQARRAKEHLYHVVMRRLTGQKRVERKAELGRKYARLAQKKPELKLFQAG